MPSALLSDTWKNTSHDFSASSSSRKSRIKIKKCVERWWSDSDWRGRVDRSTHTKPFYCATWPPCLNAVLLTPYSPVVTICTTSLTFNNSTFCPHSVFMCFMWIWEQTAIISLYSINYLTFITEMKCVYCAVRIEYLYAIHLYFRP
jgi:hypothetical protein